MMRVVLVLIYVCLVSLLVPWLPIAVWSIVFLSEPLYEISIFSVGFSKVVPFFIVAYPVFLIHSIVSSWTAVGRGQSKPVVLIKALYPLLLIIPVLMITTLLIKP